VEEAHRLAKRIVPVLHRGLSEPPLGKQPDGQKPQRDPQIGSVRDAEQKIGPRFAGEPAENDVTSDFLVRAASAQRISTREIDQIDAMPSWRLDHPRLSLHGHTGIIRDLLAPAGKSIEQRRLAAVRRADQSEVPSTAFGSSAHMTSQLR